MPDSIHPPFPVIGPNLPELEVDLDFPLTLPSSLPYETWAASCPEYDQEIELYGRIIELRAKKCAFCAKEIRLGSGGDGALVQHMLSNQCRAIQWELEKEIIGIAETDEDDNAFDSASILIPDDPPNSALNAWSISNTEMASQPRCQGAGMTVSTSLWANYPWHLHDPDHSASPPFTICRIDYTGKIIRIRSSSCASIVSQPGNQSCGACARQLKSLELKQIFKRFMRTHIAKHIRAKQCGIEDPLLHGPIGGNRCGFCGRSERCKTLLKVSKKSTSLSSDCEYFDKFSLGAAAKSTNSGPCTNRPIACQYNECLKSDPIWSYNMRSHILARHGQGAFNHAVNTGQFMITPQEDKRLQLDNMLIVPGKSPFSLSALPAVGTKRKTDDSFAIGGAATSPIVTHSPAPTDSSPAPTDSSPGASGSQSKRPRLI